MGALARLAQFVKISDCRAGGHRFNPRIWSRVEFWATFFCDTVHEQKRYVVGLVPSNDIQGT